MSCHFSCLTCSAAASFSSCTSCPVGLSLSNGYCLCNPYNNYLCSANPTANILAILEFLSSFYGLFFAAVFILYFLEVKIRYTYRLVSTLQMISFTVHCQTYYSAETEMEQRLLYKANGGIFLTFRNQSFSFSYLIPTGITLVACVIIYLSGYWLAKAFTNRKYSDYGEYLTSSAFKLLETIYYFHSKYLFFFGGVYISNLMSSSNSLGLIHIGIVYFMLVIAYFIVTFCLYQKRTLKVNFFSKTFYLYSMISSAVVLMIPLTQLTYIVFIVQIGIYIIVMLIGKHQLTRKKVIFYCGELVLICVEITFAALTDIPQMYFGLAIIILFLVLSEAEVIYTFWFVEPVSQPAVAPTKNILDKDQQDITQININNDKLQTEFNAGDAESPQSSVP